MMNGSFLMIFASSKLNLCLSYPLTQWSTKHFPNYLKMSSLLGLNDNFLNYRTTSALFNLSPQGPHHLATKLLHKTAIVISLISSGKRRP